MADQALANGTAALKDQAYYMKRALDGNHLSAALAHAASMLAELRPTQAHLTPKQYYELYIAATHEMIHLEQAFQAEHKAGKPMLELYELVQHATSVLPRLYLLIAVGGVYITSKEASAKDILRDLVEMCRGVQHPMKGLFLRNYLLQVSKDRLPDTGSEYEGVGGGIADAIGFILTNFGEMTRLWVRMQHQGPAAERARREKERSELKILVGTNLHRLSQLDGVTLDVYRELVLEQVLEVVVNCKDALAQEYLLECIMQVFPVEYHVATLSTLLRHLEHLSPATDQTVVLLNIMGGLKAHKPAADEPEEASVFTPLVAHVASAVRAAAGALGAAAVVSLHVGLVDLAVGAYPARLAYVDSALAACADELAGAAVEVPLADKPAADALKKLLVQPFLSYESALVGLDLEGWPRLLPFLAHPEQVEVSSAILSRLAEQGSVVSSPQMADKLLSFSAPLLRDDPSADDEGDEESAIDEQLVMQIAPLSRLIHTLGAVHTDTCARVLNVAYKHVAAAPQRRAPLAMVPLIFAFLKLARSIKLAVDTAAAKEPAAGAPADAAAKEPAAEAQADAAAKEPAAEAQADAAAEAPSDTGDAAVGDTPQAAADGEGEEDAPMTEADAKATDDAAKPPAAPQLAVSCHKLLSFIPRMVAVVAAVAPELALRLHLQCALVADACGEENDAYEFLTQAFTIYEEELSSQASRVSAIMLVTATIPWLLQLASETYETLVAASTKYSYKLLKKPDQSLAVAKASYQFWPAAEDKRSPQRALDCLQRALRIAADCKASKAHTALFVEALEAYMWHFEQGNEMVTVTYINSLIQLIEQHLAEEKDKTSSHHARYANLRRHIAIKAAEAPAKYEGLDLDGKSGNVTQSA